MNRSLNSALVKTIPSAQAVSMSSPRSSGLLIDTTFATSKGQLSAPWDSDNIRCNLYLNLIGLLS